MDLVEHLRQARNSPHVSFAEYIKLRARSDALVLIFEGKQCPSVYLNWLQVFLKSCGGIGGQIIARGKKNVLALRDLIVGSRGPSIDKNLYFVDRDYDIEPKQGSFSDVYVTRGYSIENSVIGWLSIESYIRAYFDIANCDDHEALTSAETLWRGVFQSYLAEAEEVHRAVYVCRTRGIYCLPGDSVLSYIQVDWGSGIVRRAYQSSDELLRMLEIPRDEWHRVLADLAGC